MSIASVRRRYFKSLTVQCASYAANSESVFAACAESCFCLFDAVSLTTMTKFQSEAHAVNCVGVDSANQVNGLHMSLKLDGTVCLWDMKQKYLAAESPSGQGFLPPGATFTCGAIRPDGLYVCTGTDLMCIDSGPSKPKKRRSGKEKPLDDDKEDPPLVYLMGWDVRKLSEPVLSLGEVHSNCVNSIRFPRDNSKQVLSCSDDGLVCISDLSAPVDDCLVEVFNAECQASYCDWLYSGKKPSIPLGVFSLNNMSTEINAWSTDTEKPQWSSLKTPKLSKHLLTAGLLKFAGTKREPKLCLVSTDTVRQDIRVSIASKRKSTVLAKRSLRSKKLGVESEMLYTALLGENACPTANANGFQMLVAGSHSLHRLQVKLT